MQTPTVTEISRLSAHRRQVEFVQASLAMRPDQRVERVPPRVSRIA